MSDEETMSLRAFCSRIKVKPSYGVELKKAGRLVMSEDGKTVRVAESIARIAATRDPSKVGVAERHAAERGAVAETGHDVETEPAPVRFLAPAETEPAPEGEGRGYQSSRSSKEHYSALREKVAYLKDIGQLMERAAVVAAFADAGATLRGKLEAWAGTLPPQLVGRDEAAIRSLIADQVEQLLHDVVARLNRATAEDVS